MRIVLKQRITIETSKRLRFSYRMLCWKQSPPKLCPNGSLFIQKRSIGLALCKELVILMKRPYALHLFCTSNLVLAFKRPTPSHMDIAGRWKYSLLLCRGAFYIHYRTFLFSEKKRKETRRILKSDADEFHALLSIFFLWFFSTSFLLCLLQWQIRGVIICWVYSLFFSWSFIIQKHFCKYNPWDVLLLHISYLENWCFNKLAGLRTFGLLFHDFWTSTCNWPPPQADTWKSRQTCNFHKHYYFAFIIQSAFSCQENYLSKRNSGYQKNYEVQ